MLLDKVLVIELVSIDGLATGAIAPGEVATLERKTSTCGSAQWRRSAYLEHELLDNSVEL